jgi:GNAT superfamily N-acetyltransferase
MQGKGISKQLLQALLDIARTKEAKKITLFSNHQLTTALSLYQ